MASVKISALASGAPAQQQDLHVLARSGANYKITTEELFSETLTLAAYTTKAANSQLIVGRTYRVTGVPYGTAVGVADSNGSLQPFTFIDATIGVRLHAIWSDSGFAVDPLVLWDNYGQVIHTPNATNNWPLGNPSFSHNLVNSCYFNFLGYSVGANLVQECELTTSALAHPGLNLYQCKLTNSYISNNGSATPMTLNDCTLDNSTLQEDGQGGTLSNCHFENCVVQLKNNPTVSGLRIFGKADPNTALPTYEIDGTFQSQVLNNWSGTVVADEIFGSSTVTFNMNWTAGADDSPGTINPDSSFVRYLPGSPVGIYLVPTFSGSDDYSPGDPFNLQYFAGPTSHPLVLRVDNMTGGTQPSLALAAGQNGLTSEECSQYHGITTKVHQLFHRNCWVEMYYGPAADSTAHWFLKTGAHYDL